KAKPLFRCAKLNRALILKHALRPYERALFDRPEPHTTKIVFPYSPTELELGGTSVMIGEKRFDQLFRNAVGVNNSDTDFDADFELLNLLHEAPSFDPFLLREQLRRIDREPARCFFEISNADTEGMLAYVASEIEPLTNLAFGASGRRAEKLSMRLAEKLMTDDGAQLLDPLRAALQMSDAQYREGVFAWKGFLYYRWLLGKLNARHETFAASFKACRVSYAGRTKRSDIEALRESIMSRADSVLWRAGEALLDYDNAFAALARGQPNVLRDFLLSAPGRFVALGEAIGAVEHLHSLWGFRFPGKGAPAAEADELLGMLEEFDRMFAGAEMLRTDDAEVMFA
ncbi:MAG: hypothetical protein R3C25_12955, partial [Hyphomonadaceae bacterium]